MWLLAALLPQPTSAALMQESIVLFDRKLAGEKRIISALFVGRDGFRQVSRGDDMGMATATVSELPVNVLMLDKGRRTLLSWTPSVFVWFDVLTVYLLDNL